MRLREYQGVNCVAVRVRLRAWVPGGDELPFQDVLVRVGARRQPQLLNAIGDRVIVVVVRDVADMKAHGVLRFNR